MNQPTILIALAILFSPGWVGAQDIEGDVQKKLEKLESRVLRLESRNDEVERNQRKLLKESCAVALISVLFGAVCAVGSEHGAKLVSLVFLWGDLQHRGSLGAPVEECREPA